LGLHHDFVEQRSARGLGGPCGGFGLFLSVGHGKSPLFSCDYAFFSSPPPSSLRSFSLAAGSVTSDWIFLRNSGRLPRGPFRAVRASRISRSLPSSGTCFATASGSMSFR